MSKKVQKVNKSPIYYPALDGLRFFAFLTVFLHHSLIIFQSNNSLINFFLIAFQKNGWVGVDLFFVLSGFLITSLILKEKNENGQFSLKNFYIRRSLRIWPLYFLALGLGFFIIPFLYQSFFNISTASFNFQIPQQLGLYLVFLGNWAVVLYNYSSFENISHLWTISMEEQFYVVWPLLLFLIKGKRKILCLGVILILVALIVRIILTLQGVQHPGIYTNTLARMDTMVAGSILALLITDFKIKFPKIIFHPIIQILSFITLFMILYRVSLFTDQIFRNSVFGYWITGSFMIYYLLSALNAPSVFAQILSLKPIVYLGKISYGLYVWHILALSLVKIFLLQTPFRILIPVIAFGLTILFGVISYNLFEKRFLLLKKHFTFIPSRPI